MKLTKRVLACLFTVLLIASIFAGCGEQAATKENGDASATTATTNAAEQTTTVSDEPVTLSVACNVDNQEAFDAFFKGFEEKYPNITIDFFPIGGAQEQSFLQSRIAMNTIPDVFGISASGFGQELAEKGILYDLSDTVAAKRLDPNAIKSYSSKSGKFYAVPYGLSTTVLYYNADLFKEKGLEAPKNWQEFLDVCKALKAEGITPLSLSMDVSIGNTAFSYGFGNNMAGKEWRNSMADGTFNFKSAEVIDIFKKVKELNDLGYLQNGVVSSDYNTSLEMFVQGKAAMHFAGIWFNGSIINADFKVGTCVPPWNVGKDQCTVVATETGWAVNAKTEHMKETLLLMDYFTGEGYPILQKARQSVPALKDQSNATVNYIVEGFLPNFSNATITAPLYYEYLPGVFQTDLSNIFQGVILNDYTPEVAAEKCQQMYDDSFKK